MRHDLINLLAKDFDMDWNNLEDRKLPKGKPGTMLVCLVSAKNKHGESYVTFASYDENEDVWRDGDLRQIDVYAWHLPIPAEDRG